MIVECVDVTVSVGSGANRVTPLSGLNLSVAPAEAVAITGPSGSGKTTLLRLLAGELTADEGSVDIDGMEVAQAVAKRGVGMLHQDYRLVPFLSALHNVSLALEIRGLTDGATDRAATLLAELGLAGEVDRRPHELSGGQQQRVALARALSIRPRVILADEPTAALDPRIAASAVRQMVEVARGAGAALLIATHDEKVARVTDRRLLLTDGQLVEVP